MMRWAACSQQGSPSGGMGLISSLLLEVVQGRMCRCASGKNLRSIAEIALGRSVMTQRKGAMPFGVSRSNTNSKRTRDCIDADDMDGICAEYRANEYRANQKYVGQRMCLRGTITDFSESTNYRNVNAEVGGDPPFGIARFSISHRKGSDGRDEDWESWMMSKSVGDVVEAECTVEKFWHPDIPTFRDCERMKE